MSSEKKTAYLMVEKGEPYISGEFLPLGEGEVLLGREWEEHRPDISFQNRFISRSHARICGRSGEYFIMELPSCKLGTAINGRKLEKTFLIHSGTGTGSSWQWAKCGSSFVPILHRERRGVFQVP